MNIRCALISGLVRTRYHYRRVLKLHPADTVNGTPRVDRRDRYKFVGGPISQGASIYIQIGLKLSAREVMIEPRPRNSAANYRYYYYYHSSAGLAIIFQLTTCIKVSHLVDFERLNHNDNRRFNGILSSPWQR